MGVLSERIFTLFLAVPWRQQAGTRAPKDITEPTPRDWTAEAPTRQTGWHYSPSTSVLRADLEMVRHIARVR
jgi:hypothetical protein